MPPSDDLLFPSGSDPKKPMDPAALRRGPWARALRKAGLPYRHSRTLRHSFVSMLTNRPDEPKYFKAE